MCVFLRRNDEDHQLSFSMGVQIAGEANLLGCEDMECRHTAIHTSGIWCLADVSSVSPSSEQTVPAKG